MTFVNTLNPNDDHESNLMLDSALSNALCADSLRRLHRQVAGLQSTIPWENCGIPRLKRDVILGRETRLAPPGTTAGSFRTRNRSLAHAAEDLSKCFMDADFTFCLNAVHIVALTVDSSSHTVPVQNFLTPSMRFETLSHISAKEVHDFLGNRPKSLAIFILANALRLSIAGGETIYRKTTLEIGRGIERMTSRSREMHLILDVSTAFSDAKLLHVLNLSPKLFLPFAVMTTEYESLD